jgi:hypothetical protein
MRTANRSASDSIRTFTQIVELAQARAPMNYFAKAKHIDLICAPKQSASILIPGLPGGTAYPSCQYE